MISCKYQTKCGNYQYYSSYIVDRSKPILAVIGLNPSITTVESVSPTVKRLLQLAKKEGYGGIQIVNIYGYITPHPKNLSTVPDPIGPNNDEWIRKVVNSTDKILCIWGNNGSDFRKEKILSELGDKAYMISLTKQGNPRHILHHNSDIEIKKISYDTKESGV